MKPNVLVYGWYGQGNIGDELFKEAFAHLFPNYNLTFTSRLTPKLLEKTSAIFIGGGSFLYAPLNMTEGLLESIKQKKIFYIGVGMETDIHPMHLELMKQAQLIATRSPEKLEYVQSLNTNSIAIPDIVYSLKDIIKKEKKIPKSVLIMTNTAVVPNHTDAHWKHTSWDYFKNEFSQFLDFLISEKYFIKFFAMCQNKKSDDHWASIELLNRMQNKSNNFLLDNKFTDIGSLTSFLSQYETIITQRFHGIVLAELLRTPYLSIHHHDKLKFSSPGTGIFIPYYGASKALLKNSFETISDKFPDVLSIEDNTFEELVKSVSSLVNDG